MAEFEASEPLISNDTVQSDSEADASLYKAIEQIHLDKNKLPPELRDSLDLEKIKEFLHQSNSFSVLICGKTGTGKSSLVNSIVGQDIADVGDKLIQGGITTEVTAYKRKVDGVDVNAWDSPGLSDGSDSDNQRRYISDMVEKCSNADLILYCIKMYEKRFPKGSDNPDVNAMAAITKGFGREIWKKTMLVLTYANVVEAHNVDWVDLDEVAKEAAFQEEVKSWRVVLCDVLINQLHVPEEIANHVVVIPAGHYKTRQLPDRDFWLSTLWFQCLSVITTPEGRVSLVRINALRIKQRKQVKKEEFKKPGAEQPIVVDHSVLQSRYSKKALVAGLGLNTVTIAAGGGLGAAIGASVGAAGAGFGAAIGAPIGFAVGLIVVAVVATVQKHRRAKKATKMATEKAIIDKDADSELSELGSES